MNPFYISGDIPDQYFCDRQHETERLVRGLLGGENFCIMAPRRMGKSKLVRHCFLHPELSSHITFYVDILHTTSLSEMVYALGREIFKHLSASHGSVLTNVARAFRSLSGGIGFDPQTGLPTFSVQLGDITRPAYTLAEIFEALEGAGQPCVVCLDEFQQVGAYPESGVEALLRSHIQDARNAHFIFSGSERHLLDEMFCSQARPFYNSVEMIELQPIPLPAYVAFAQEHFAAKGITVPTDVISHAYSLMRGNTYYVQKVSHALYDLLDSGATATTAHVDCVLENMVDESAGAYSRIMSRVPERQKQLLYAIAHDGVARQLTSGAFVHRHALHSPSSVQAALRKLLELDLVSQDGNSFVVSDPLLVLWIDSRA